MAEALACKWETFLLVLERVEVLWNEPAANELPYMIVAGGCAPRVFVAWEGRDYLAGVLNVAWQEMLSGAVIAQKEEETNEPVSLELQQELSVSRSPRGWSALCDRLGTGLRQLGRS